MATQSPGVGPGYVFLSRLNSAEATTVTKSLGSHKPPLWNTFEKIQSQLLHKPCSRGLSICELRLKGLWDSGTTSPDSLGVAVAVSGAPNLRGCEHKDLCRRGLFLWVSASCAFLLGLALGWEKSSTKSSSANAAALGPVPAGALGAAPFAKGLASSSCCSSNGDSDFA